jgi:hypothetical protein
MSEPIVASNCFLIDQPTSSAWLARKMRKIGVGLWNGYGGKQEPGQTIVECTVDEIFVETDGAVIVEPADLVYVANIEFYNACRSVFDVHIFLAWKFRGTPRKSKEMGDPQLFPFAEIPYHEMMPADRLWLPRVLKGEKIIGQVCYSDDMSRVISSQFSSLDILQLPKS